MAFSFSNYQTKSLLPVELVDLLLVTMVISQSGRVRYTHTKDEINVLHVLS